MNNIYKVVNESGEIIPFKFNTIQRAIFDSTRGSNSTVAKRARDIILKYRQ